MPLVEVGFRTFRLIKFYFVSLCRVFGIFDKKCFKKRRKMDLEIIILSEVSQKEKDKYPRISLICGI